MEIDVDIFSNQILLELIDYLFQFIQTKIAIPKDLKTRRYYLPKAITDHYYVTMNGKNFHDQPIDSDIKRKNKKVNNRAR